MKIMCFSYHNFTIGCAGGYHYQTSKIKFPSTVHIGQHYNKFHNSAVQVGVFTKAGHFTKSNAGCKFDWP